MHAVYRIGPALLYVGPADDVRTHDGPDPIVIITPPAAGSAFGCKFSAGDTFAAIAAASELDAARELCQAANTRALVDDGSAAPDYWFLVTRDGSSGRVFTDPEADGLFVVHAFEPIPGEPDLPSCHRRTGREPGEPSALEGQARTVCTMVNLTVADVCFS